jgi:hypothetical protein
MWQRPTCGVRGLGVLAFLVWSGTAVAFAPASQHNCGPPALRPRACSLVRGKLARGTSANRLRIVAPPTRGFATHLSVGVKAAAGGGEKAQGRAAKSFESFTQLEMAAGNGELTLLQALDATRKLAAKQAELKTLDMMAALGACFASADVSVAGVTIEDLWALVGEFESKSAVPNKMSCTHMLGICVHLAAAGIVDQAEALRILRWSKDKGINPDHVMIAQVMNVGAKAAAYGRCTLPVLLEVLDYAANLDPPVPGNVFTYTVLKSHVVLLLRRSSEGLYCFPRY